MAKKSVWDYESHNSSPLGRLSGVYGHYNLNIREDDIELPIFNILHVCCKNTDNHKMAEKQFSVSVSCSQWLQWMQWQCSHNTVNQAV